MYALAHVILIKPIEGGGILGPIIQIRKLRFRDRGEAHTVSKYWNWDLSLGSLAPANTFFFLIIKVKFT